VVTALNGPAPGTAPFRRALIEALNGALAEAGCDSAEITSEEQVSRNTLIYRCRIAGKRLVAKAQLTKPPWVVVAEYRMLLDMAGTLGTGPVRALRPVAVFEHLGTLVTEEEEGVFVRTLLVEALAGDEAAWRRGLTAIEAAAAALRVFHASYTGATRGEDIPWARSYLDFSSKNILLKPERAPGGRPHVVLLDPPEEERWVHPTEDIGVFCFDMARIVFLPRFVLRPGVRSRVDHMKLAFIRHYYQTSVLDRGILDRIEAAERRRADQTLKWYLVPWRYGSVVKETARLCYLGPLTAGYRMRGVRRSYARLAHLLTESTDGRSTPAGA
jgi:hypothetical protein